MRIPGLLALIAAAGLPCTAVHAQPADRVALVVSDHLGTGQQEETISVFLGGVLSGTLHVTADHPDDRFVTSVPTQPVLTFTLCGKLLKREADGTLSNHPIDNGGTLAGVRGGQLDAITLNDVLFSLLDVNGWAQTQVSRGPACSAAVS